MARKLPNPSWRLPQSRSKQGLPPSGAGLALPFINNELHVGICKIKTAAANPSNKNGELEAWKTRGISAWLKGSVVSNDAGLILRLFMGYTEEIQNECYENDVCTGHWQRVWNK